MTRACGTPSQSRCWAEDGGCLSSRILWSSWLRRPQRTKGSTLCLHLFLSKLHYSKHERFREVRRRLSANSPSSFPAKRQHVGFGLGRRCAEESLPQQTKVKIINYFKLQKNGQGNSLNTHSSRFAAPYTLRSHTVELHSQLSFFSFVPVPNSQLPVHKSP